MDDVTHRRIESFPLLRRHAGVAQTTAAGFLIEKVFAGSTIAPAMLEIGKSRRKSTQEKTLPAP